MTRDKLRQGLLACGIEIPKAGIDLSIWQCYGALTGAIAKQAALARQAQAQAEMCELEAAELRKDLMRRVDVEKFVTGILLQLREQINAMPATLCGRVNPADPVHARAVLLEWGDQLIAMMRGVKE